MRQRALDRKCGFYFFNPWKTTYSFKFNKHNFIASLNQKSMIDHRKSCIYPGKKCPTLAVDFRSQSIPLPVESFPFIFRETPCCQAAVTEAETSFLIAAARITLQPLTTPFCDLHEGEQHNSSSHNGSGYVDYMRPPAVFFFAALDLARLHPKVKNWICFYKSSDIGVLKCQGLISQKQKRQWLHGASHAVIAVSVTVTLLCVKVKHSLTQ